MKKMEILYDFRLKISKENFHFRFIISVVIFGEQKKMGEKIIRISGLMFMTFFVLFFLILLASD